MGNTNGMRKVRLFCFGRFINEVSLFLFFNNFVNINRAGEGGGRGLGTNQGIFFF